MCATEYYLALSHSLRTAFSLNYIYIFLSCFLPFFSFTGLGANGRANIYDNQNDNGKGGQQAFLLEHNAVFVMA